jgi:hypothetical protein
VIDEFSVTSEEVSEFSDKIEREDHQRRMNELRLFAAPADQSSPKKGTIGGPMAQTGAFYASEASRILRAFEGQVASLEEMSTMSPVSVFSSSIATTTSELETRVAHQEKMAELELFSTTNIAGSISLLMASVQSSLSRVFDLDGGESTISKGFLNILS